jgi:hypothetical protein
MLCIVPPQLYRRILTLFRAPLLVALFLSGFNVSMTSTARAAQSAEHPATIAHTKNTFMVNLWSQIMKRPTMRPTSQAQFMKANLMDTGV